MNVSHLRTHAPRAVILSLLMMLALTGLAVADDARPKHLTEAELLVSHLDLAHTTYNHGEPSVDWTQCASYADCSGFVDELLKHSYGYTPDDLKKWFGSHRPTARRYHEAIEAQTGFTTIADLSLVAPGDFLAVKYLNRTDNTGHVMLVAAIPKRMTKPNVVAPQFQAWEVPVIDSSMSGHGPTDSRHALGINGKDHDGLGRGVLCVYTEKGRVAGFSWSTGAKSEFRAPADEPLVIGRLIPGFKP